MIQSAAPSAVILHDEGLNILAKYLNGHSPIFTTKNPSDTVELLKTLVSQNSLVVLKGSHRDTRMWEISKILRKRASSRVVTVKSQKYSNSPLRESENIINSAFFRPIVGDEERNSFLIGVLGDTYFGEYYASKMDVSRRFHPLHLNNYDFGFRSFSNFLKSNDLNIANLETALTAATVSPFGEARPYTHWARPDETLSCFRRHNIQVATLANNHVYDFGRAGVLETLAACNRLQVMTIGAGSDPVEARRPLRVECGASAGGGAAMRRREMLIFAGLAYRDVIRDRFEAYAEAGRPGCASLSDPLLFEAIKEARWRNRESLIVVIPHWQRDYQWASRRQRSFAFSALEAGADLVIGHGAHMLQQIERFGDGLAVHGLGNFVFNAPGRYRSSFAPPISAAVRLILPVDHAKAVKLRLYPILSDNRKTEYQPRFILGREVGQFLAMYVDLGLTPPDGRWSSDDDGYFLEFVLKSFTGTADDARSANISSETMLA